MNFRSFAPHLMVAALAFSSASGAFAQSVSTPDPKAVKAGTYKVETSHTQVGFTLSHFGFSNYSGVFSGASGTLTLDPGTVSVSKLEVTIPVASVETTSGKLDDELKSAQWFDATKYPNATFSSTKITRTGARTATIAGDLTLHGVTKPVVLKAHLVGSGVNPIDKAYTVGFEASGVIQRSAFGVTQYVPLVGDDVTLTIAGAFELQP